MPNPSELERSGNGETKETIPVITPSASCGCKFSVEATVLYAKVSGRETVAKFVDLSDPKALQITLHWCPLHKCAQDMQDSLSELMERTVIIKDTLLFRELDLVLRKSRGEA